MQQLLGNAEVERAQQAARQAELLASEAKKGEVEEKHKTSESLAKFPSNFWSFCLPPPIMGMVGPCQVGLSTRLKAYVRTRYKVTWAIQIQKSPENHRHKLMTVIQT